MFLGGGGGRVGEPNLMYVYSSAARGEGVRCKVKVNFCEAMWVSEM